MPTNIILTPDQEKLKILMILKYGDLNVAFWSSTSFTPKENRILEHNLMITTDKTHVKLNDEYSEYIPDP